MTEPLTGKAGRMKSNALRYPNARRTRQQKLAAAVNLICFCTPDRFASLTAQDVANHSGIPVATAEQMLASARQGRLV